MPTPVQARGPGGVWLGASYALGRPVPVDEAYPHICGIGVVGRATGTHFRIWRRDCAACQANSGTREA